jgi:hypothetical protein
MNKMKKRDFPTGTIFFSSILQKQCRGKNSTFLLNWEKNPSISRKLPVQRNAEFSGPKKKKFDQSEFCLHNCVC